MGKIGFMHFSQVNRHCLRMLFTNLSAFCQPFNGVRSLPKKVGIPGIMLN